LLENTTTSESKSKPKQKPETTGPKSINSTSERNPLNAGLRAADLSSCRKGDSAEHFAIAALMARGLEVFHNAGGDGPVDLLFGYVGQAFYAVNVKLARYMCGTSGRHSWSSTQACKVPDGIYPLLVVPHTGQDITGWELKWHVRKETNKPVCPPGFEDFWN
jgi:hypothetical protein